MTTLAYTLDVIALCVFGVDTNACEDPQGDNGPWEIANKEGFTNTCTKKPSVFHNNSQKRKRKEAKTDVIDFATLLLTAESTEGEGGDEAKKREDRKVKLDEVDIRSNCKTFFVAGFETTAAFLHFTLCAIAMNSDIQEKLYNDINEYFKLNETIDYDSLNSLPYFDAVGNESLRLYSPITIFEYTCGENYQLNDVVIEKGTVINQHIYAMHRDPELFPNPHDFLPVRFMPNNKDYIKPYSFMPFSIGPRMCIGNRFSNFHSKLFLANFIKNYEIIKTANTPDKPEYNGTYMFLACKPMLAAIRGRESKK